MKRLLYVFGILMSTSLLGVIGFMTIEDHSLIDALYMTIITMSTVGFGTLGELSQEGKLFVVFLIIFTMGAFFYAISSITSFIVEGELRSIVDKYRVNSSVKKLKNHIIICGLGRNGSEAATELLADKVPFVVLENDQEAIDDFYLKDQILVLQLDATHDDSLVQANIAEAKGLITALSDDAANVFVSLTAKELNPGIEIVSRASYETSISKLKRAGAGKVVLPNQLGGRKMARLLTRPQLVEFVEMVTGQGESNYELEFWDCSQHPKMIDKSLAELEIRNKTGVMVIGIKDKNGKILLNPNAHHKLNPEEKLFLLGHPDQIKSFWEIYD